MSFNILPISSSQVINLSASYRYDDKISLNPVKYDYDNGFSLFHHDVLRGTKDVQFANHSFFAITSSTIFENIMKDTMYLDPRDLVLYTALIAPNNKYVTNYKNILYANSDTFGTSEYFRISRNDDNTFAIIQNNLYATVITEKHSFSIHMLPKIVHDVNNLQKFVFYSTDDSGTFTIQSLFRVPQWGNYFENVLRFWSYYDGDSLFYDGEQPNMIKTIGKVPSYAYNEQNLYAFRASMDVSNMKTFAIGFDGKIKWVRYHHDFFNKFYNRNVDIKDYVDSIDSNFLIEYPYRHDITNVANKTGTMGLNLITLKNVMTPEYNYAVREISLP